MRLATLSPVWANCRPNRKPFEITLRRPHCEAGDELAIGPTNSGFGKGQRHIWGRATIGEQWRAPRAALYECLASKGLLAKLLDYEKEYLKEHINKYDECAEPWVTELNDGRGGQMELLHAGIQLASLPGTSMGWPYLQAEAAAAIREAI